MATPLTADRIVSALKAEGVKVAEYRSWRTHNRNSKGAWGPVHGVMIHHTVTSADDSSVALCYNGHSTLPGPLCHAVGRNDGVVALVGHGRANHAGSGDPRVLTAVIAEQPTPAPVANTRDGNALLRHRTRQPGRQPRHVHAGAVRRRRALGHCSVSGARLGRCFRDRPQGVAAREDRSEGAAGVWWLLLHVPVPQRCQRPPEGRPEVSLD